jgi:hypothetical protein
MTLRKLPTIPYPSTTQQYVLDGTVFSLAFRWSQRGECWYMDLSTVDGTPILTGRKLVTGFPLLRRVVAATRPKGELVMLDTKGLGGRPTLEEFGTRYALFYEEAG